MSRGWGNAMAVLAAVSYGSALPLSRLAYDHGTNALTVLSLRFLAVTLVLAVWLRFTARSYVMPVRLVAASAVIGVTFTAISGGTLGAVVFIPVSLSVLVFYTYPMLTLATVSVLERRVPRTAELIAVVAALIGVGLAVKASYAQLHPAGIGLALMAAVGATAAFIIASRTLPRGGTALVTGYACATAFLIGATMTLALDAVAIPRTTHGIALLGAILIIFGTAVVSMFVGLRLIGPVRSATILCLEPVTAIFVAVLMLDERLTALQWLGAALVGAAILIASRRPAEP